MNPLATWSLGSITFLLRRAVVEDVPAIVDLLADDPLGASRDGAQVSDLAPYRRAFDTIDADPAQLLLAVTADEGTVAGTMQVTFLPGMARRGALRAQIEAVRVHRTYRGCGLGREMLQWSIDEAGRRGCALVQLTSDKTRTDAHRFYERLGFVASHEGLKLVL